jgi:hypothetical protein
VNGGLGAGVAHTVGQQRTAAQPQPVAALRMLQQAQERCVGWWAVHGMCIL